jgi:hypothetical protein
VPGFARIGASNPDSRSLEFVAKPRAVQYAPAFAAPGLQGLGFKGFPIELRE